MAKNFINKDHDAIADQKYAKDVWGTNNGSKTSSAPVGTIMTSQHSGFNSAALITNIFFKSLAEKKMAAALNEQGFTMIGQLSGKSKADLIALNGVGKVSADKILGALANV